VARASTTFDVNVTDHQPLSGILGSGTSYIATQIASGGAQSLCTGLNDPKCALNAEIYSMLPVCQSSIEINCIEALEVSSENELFRQATHQKTIGQEVFSAKPEIGLPAGSNISLWSVPSLRLEGKQSDFAVTVRVKLIRSGENLRASGFSARVEPFTQTTTSQSPLRTVERLNPLGVAGISAEGGDKIKNCIWIDNGQCGQDADFPKDSRVKLTIRIGNYLTAWLHGRFTDPRIRITSIDEMNNRLEMDAAPVKVPSATAIVNADEAPIEVINRFKDPSGYLPSGNISMYIEATQYGALQSFLEFERFFSRKSNKLVDTWSLHSLPSQINACASISNRVKEPLGTLIGIVATNALTYESQPPSFADGELKYKVAGLHYLSDGTTVFQGRYDLLMRSDFARCLYNFTDAPMSAEISIVNEEGAKFITTTSLRESNGWFMLGAYGFTFSAPILRVKLIQENKIQSPPTATATATPSPSPTPTASATKSPIAVVKKTITCIKGKVTKKVTAVSPKCPAGYKKK
jgi:hypothetical protein